MADFNINVKKMNDIGKAIEDLSFDFVENINKFYEIISLLSSKKVIWNGKSVEEYVNKCLLEKEDYINFGKGIKNLGACLISYSEKIEQEANKFEVSNNDYS